MENLVEYMESYNKRLEEGIKNVEVIDYDETDLLKGAGFMHRKYEDRIEFIKKTIPDEEREEALFMEECQYIKALRKSDELAKKLITSPYVPPKPTEEEIEEFLSNWK